MSYTKEIQMIENYLNNNHICTDNLNIKIIFSIMQGFGEDDTCQ